MVARSLYQSSPAIHAGADTRLIQATTVAMQTQHDLSSKKQDNPVSSACVPCRSRHLKCDGLAPTCSRCQTTDTNCYYIQSRRGLRPQKADNAPRIVPSQASFPLEESSDSGAILGSSYDPAMFSGLGMDDLSSEFLLGSVPTPIGHTQQSLEQALEASSTLNLPNAVNIPPNELVPAVGDRSKSPSSGEVAFDPMIQLYYQNFHGSHPFAVPWKAVNSPLCQFLPSYLLSVMRYIGSHYHPNPSFRDIYQRKAHRELSSDTSRTGFKVQGLLLISIVDHSSGYEDRALQTLETAIKMALDIQMNTESFVLRNSGGNAVLEESWRRTYWELYVVSGLFAAFRQETTFALHSQYADVRLPCRDELYNAAGVIPRGVTLEAFQNFWLRDDSSNNFSSFSYRIQATQILGTILSLGHYMDNSDEAQAEAIDSRLASISLHLPPAQREVYRSDGVLDEMTLQAQMINYLSLISLHYPRSNMRFVPFRNPSSCVRQQTIEDGSNALPNLDLHSVKSLRAADMLASLAALPSPIKRQTPFMTCGLAITVTVHLAAALTQAGGARLDTLKARIDLALGGLNMLGEVWPLARAIRKQLLGLYSEMISKHG